VLVVPSDVARESAGPESGEDTPAA
jgi:hypothetical protein